MSINDNKYVDPNQRLSREAEIKMLFHEEKKG